MRILHLKKIKKMQDNEWIFALDRKKGFSPCVIKVQMCSNSKSLFGSNTNCGILDNLFFASLPCSSQSPAHIVSQSENSSFCIRQEKHSIFLTELSQVRSLR